jgi:hypothetical protein
MSENASMGTSASVGMSGTDVTSDTERSPGGEGLDSPLGHGGQRERPGTPEEAVEAGDKAGAHGQDAGWARTNAGENSGNPAGS